MAEPSFSGHEQECILFSADRFNDGGRVLNLRELPGYKEVGHEETIRVINRFVNFGWLAWETQVCLTIHGSVMDAAQAIRNPPPKDYWMAVSVWFRSKPWSIAVFVLAVALPIIAQWIVWLGKLLEWIGYSQVAPSISSNE